MTAVSGFPAIESSRASILILGSMPGIRSLEQQQYYAHPQNSFWYIMEQLFAINRTLDYPVRRQQLIENKIALWDVMQACVRSGSLDSSIQTDSIIANDFVPFFDRHHHINAVFFNGAKSEQTYRKYVLPTLPKRYAKLHYQRLPSTSPAHAAVSKADKLQQWSVIKDCLP